MLRHLLILSLLWPAVACFVQAEEFLLEIVDETGQPLPARVRVRDKSGADHLPSDALQVPLGLDQWFVTAGSSKLTVPSGPLEIRVEHGLEFLPHKSATLIKPNQKAKHRITLNRWVDMLEQGYKCGENHLHVPLPELAPQLVAEGLDFGTSLHWWNAKRFSTPLAGGYIRDLKFAGKLVPTSVFDYEIEHDWGAVYVVGQPTPLEDENDSSIPNLPILQRSHDTGALVCYQGGWSREVLLDALLGTVDVVNICNNNFLRHAYQPRSRYSNLLEVPGFPIYANNADDMLRMNTETYYRLLNCGLRLAAGAGSATGPKLSPVGYNRTYVRMEDKTSYEEFLERWRAGQNFVTNGPMLKLQADDRYHPGDTIDLENSSNTLLVNVTVHSPHPITSLEIILNGQVVHQATTAELDATELDEITIKVPIEIKAGAWLAARCTAKDQLLSDEELAAYEWGKPKMPRQPTRLKFAHTSPIYINVNGHGVRVEQSILEAKAMLKAFTKFSRQETSEATLDQLERALSKARKRLANGNF